MLRAQMGVRDALKDGVSGAGMSLSAYSITASTSTFSTGLVTPTQHA